MLASSDMNMLCTYMRVLDLSPSSCDSGQCRRPCQCAQCRHQCAQCRHQYAQCRRQCAQCRHLSLIHISEPTRLLSISYAVFCLKKKKKNDIQKNISKQINMKK
eukprot:TRINITY_DN1739_c0_g1_i3.p1 TRINITY_DN1739_c0_g1~~TRINITY_DN1739_c0_g1_i3.p1  ORF type:complete len:104 (+),score=10.78 TRINITY_DN1739_c0_g1_i3:195-506(+)